jgi:hypothetical protein
LILYGISSLLLVTGFQVTGDFISHDTSEEAKEIVVQVRFVLDI